MRDRERAFKRERESARARASERERAREIVMALLARSTGTRSSDSGAVSASFQGPPV